MLKKLLLGVCVGVSFPLFSVYATAAECLKGCERNKSTTKEDLQKCEAGCQDGLDSISVSTSGANADISGRSIRKTNPSGNRN